MDIRLFPGCCTALVICDINLNDGIYDSDDIFEDDAQWFPLRNEWKDRSWNQLEESVHQVLLLAKQEGFGYVMATTTSAQKGANDMLERMGWYATPWGNKTRHTETQLRTWSFKLDELED